MAVDRSILIRALMRKALAALSESDDIDDLITVLMGYQTGALSNTENGLVLTSSSVSGKSYSFTVMEGTTPGDIMASAEFLIQCCELDGVENLSSVPNVVNLCLRKRKTIDFTGLTHG